MEDVSFDGDFGFDALGFDDFNFARLRGDVFAVATIYPV